MTRIHLQSALLIALCFTFLTGFGDCNLRHTPYNPPPRVPEEVEPEYPENPEVPPEQPEIPPDEVEPPEEVEPSTCDDGGFPPRVELDVVRYDELCWSTPVASVELESQTELGDLIAGAWLRCPGDTLHGFDNFGAGALGVMFFCDGTWRPLVQDGDGLILADLRTWYEWDYYVEPDPGAAWVPGAITTELGILYLQLWEGPNQLWLTDGPDSERFVWLEDVAL